MGLFGRRDEMPNGSMLSGPSSFVMPSVTPATKPRVERTPQLEQVAEEPRAEEPRDVPVHADPPSVEEAKVEESAPESVTTDTAPIPVQASPYLYDERLHIKYMFTFYGGPLMVIFVALVAIFAVPMVIGLLLQLQEEWFRLETIPVIGVLARVVRVIVMSILEALWGVVVSLVTQTGAGGIITTVVLGLIVLLVLLVLIIRPIYAWRISRVRVSHDKIELLKPGNKLLFLNDHSIRIKDTSIVRGATEEVLAFDKWVFPGAASITIEKDDLGGKGDEKAWGPVREYEELVKAVETVILHRKAQSNPA